MRYIYCRQCGAQNLENDAKCLSCGESLEVVPASSAKSVETHETPVSAGEYTSKPPVLKWYVIYCTAMAFMYLVCVIFGVVLLTIDLTRLNMSKDLMEVKIQAVVLIVVGFPLFIAYAAAPFFPKKPWNWTAGIVLICLGMTSCCCLPACIPLLIHWIKPECKDYFKA